jgi:hypothetical protein
MMERTDTEIIIEQNCEIIELLTLILHQIKSTECQCKPKNGNQAINT